MHFAFHDSLLVSPQDAFSTPLLSIMQTFSMMLGDINYRDAFLEPFLRDELAYPLLSFVQLIVFTMFVPIVLMNLLVSNLSQYFLFAASKMRHFTSFFRASSISLQERERHRWNLFFRWGLSTPAQRGAQGMQRCIHLANAYQESPKWPRHWPRCQDTVVPRHINTQPLHEYNLVVKLSSKQISMQ